MNKAILSILTCVLVDLCQVSLKEWNWVGIGTGFSGVDNIKHFSKVVVLIPLLPAVTERSGVPSAPCWCLARHSGSSAGRAVLFCHAFFHFPHVL